MITAINLLPGLLMVAVGAIAAGYWYWKKHSKLMFFAAGAIFWVVAIAVKVIMDLTITGPLTDWLNGTLPVDATVLAMGLYLGLRTGILENGAVYLGTLFTKLKEMSFDDAVAVGIGFGGIEAIVLGILSLVSVILLLLNPTLYLMMPLSSQQQFDPLFMPLPVIERIFTLFCHVFATVLTIYAVKLADLKWLGIAVIYKTVLDGSLPLFTHYLGGLGVNMYFPIEAFVVVMGCIGLAGTYWLRKTFGGAAAAPKAGDARTGH